MFEGLMFLAQALSLSGHQEAFSGSRARLVSRVRLEEAAGQLAVKAFKAKASLDSHASNATTLGRTGGCPRTTKVRQTGHGAGSVRRTGRHARSLQRGQKNTHPWD